MIAGYLLDGRAANLAVPRDIVQSPTCMREHPFPFPPFTSGLGYLSNSSLATGLNIKINHLVDMSVQEEVSGTETGSLQKWPFH